jgi:hypothetical protein
MAMRAPSTRANEIGANNKNVYVEELLQREWMFGFDTTERVNREPAAGVALHVFDVGSGTCAGFFQRLHWAVTV